MVSHLPATARSRPGRRSRPSWRHDPDVAVRVQLVREVDDAIDQVQAALRAVMKGIVQVGISLQAASEMRDRLAAKVEVGEPRHRALLAEADALVSDMRQKSVAMQQDYNSLLGRLVVLQTAKVAILTM